MSMPTFVDLQGFIVNKKFIVKEVAVLKRDLILDTALYICATRVLFPDPSITAGNISRVLLQEVVLQKVMLQKMVLQEVMLQGAKRIS
ncbi:hypothetical protein ALC56_09124 [Trachymyrmex septentrionalis]|uniref:Uncharacterized protein n=1 Tax=Trachymyrmex septentrionalis TaxID=34720 RepID=A0A151JUI8_9HYME|nr:hypothetical protein ALC56_09124 [Trachymyrmex septentrionalis]